MSTSPSANATAASVAIEPVGLAQRSLGMASSLRACHASPARSHATPGAGCRATARPSHVARLIVPPAVDGVHGHSRVGVRLAQLERQPG